MDNEKKKNIPEKKEKPKKELSPEQLRKRKMYMVMPVFFLVFGLCMYWIFAPSKKSQELKENSSGFNANIPMPKDEGLFSDKQKAFEMEQLTKSNENRMKSLNEVSSALADVSEKKSPDLNPSLEESSSKPQKQSSIRSSASAYQNMNRELATFYEPTKSNEIKALEKKIEELSERLEASESQKNNQEDQLKMMEKSYQMAAKYIVPVGSEKVPEEANHPIAEKANSISKGKTVNPVREKTVSGLQQQISDSTFMVQYVKPRNMGFNTAVGTGYEVSKNTIKACIYQDQTLENGQTVRLRLMEPLQAGNITVERNTIVSGVARLNGERLDILIASIEFRGNIIPVELAVYDTDGQPGINIPGSMEINAVKEAAANIGSGMGTSISFAQSAGQQIAMDATRGVMQAGSQYLSKKLRTVKVNLKAGYEVMLLLKQQ